MPETRGPSASAVAMVLVVAACGDSAEPPPPVGSVSVDRLDTLVTTASALIGHPTDLAIAPGGDVYIADRQAHRVFRVRPDGTVVDSIGGAGEGPGEFDGPSAVAAGGDTVWVVDEGNGRLQTLSPAGVPLGSARLPPEIRLNPATLGPGRSLALGTMGSDSTLALRVDAGGEQRGIGRPVVPPPQVFDMTAIKDRIAGGGIPDEFRNAVLAADDASGTVWVALQSDAEVRRYGADGALLWTLALRSPALEPILEDFFRRNAEEDAPFAIHPLFYFADIAIVGEEAWLLLNAPVDRPATILRIAADGTQAGSITVPGARGARALAFDEERDILYLGIPRDAQIVAGRLS